MPIRYTTRRAYPFRLKGLQRGKTASGVRLLHHEPLKGAGGSFLVEEAERLSIPSGLAGREEPMRRTGQMPRKNPAAVALGRLGGQATSPAKRRAARENGLLGGRPKRKGSRSR